jgi:hypothetical protein
VWQNLSADMHNIARAVLVIVLAVVPGIAAAHHGIVNFDMNREIEISGTIARLAFVDGASVDNPRLRCEPTTSSSTGPSKPMMDSRDRRCGPRTGGRGMDPGPAAPSYFLPTRSCIFFTASVMLSSTVPQGATSLSRF